jgi:hypothetical protein
MTTNKTGANTRLAQWVLTSFIETLCFYCKFVLVDNLVFQNPPLRQAWERCVKFPPIKKPAIRGGLREAGKKQDVQDKPHSDRLKKTAVKTKEAKNG